jgi:hypothetical protein
LWQGAFVKGEANADSCPVVRVTTTVSLFPRPWGRQVLTGLMGTSFSLIVEIPVLLEIVLLVAKEAAF